MGDKLDALDLREAGDEVAATGAKRIADETGRLRIEGISQRLVKFRGQQFRKLILESFAFLVRERKVAGICADSQDLGIDEFKLGIEAGKFRSDITRLLRFDVLPHAVLGSQNFPRGCQSENFGDPAMEKGF